MKGKKKGWSLFLAAVMLVSTPGSVLAGDTGTETVVISEADTVIVESDDGEGSASNAPDEEVEGASLSSDDVTESGSIAEEPEADSEPEEMAGDDSIAILDIEEVATVSSDFEETSNGLSVSEASASLSDAIEIDSPEDFLGIFDDLSADYVLTSDLYMSDYPVSVNLWTTFSGTLDGQGYTIYDLSIEPESDSCVLGLFASVTGTIQNLNLVNASLSAANNTQYPNVGILSGNLDGGSILNCSVSGTITIWDGTYSDTWTGVGGLIGYTSSGTIRSCTSSVDITVSNQYSVNIGGITSVFASGTLEDCVYDGTISLTQTGTQTDQDFLVTGIAYCGYESDTSAYAQNCTVNGSLVLKTTDSMGRAFGIWTANDSVNNASISVEVGEAYGAAYGAHIGTELTNTGSVSIKSTGSDANT
ncbi:MAG: hypothetical protein LUF30_02985, partial [Lachnospiraceae bacterium]|nr:hypothetical protein [Lachnospiraceae bacterium]